MYTMSSAGGDYSPDDRYRMQTRMSPPDNEIPGAIALNVTIGRTDNLAVAITGVHAYSAGLRFSLAVRCRGSVDAIGEGLFAHHGHWGRRGGEMPLLLGVEYNDGRTATNFGGRFGWRQDDGGPVLSENGGGGGGRRYDMSYWLNPLPTGDLTVVCAWPGRGIDETRTVIPGDAIATARAAVVELWPWEPEPEPETPPESPPLELPPGSWFAGKFPPSPQPPGEDSGWVRYGPGSE